VQSFFSKGLDQVDDPLFSHMIRWENTSKIKNFFSGDLSHAIGSYCGYEQLKESLPEDYESADSLSRAQYLETAIFLSGYLLSSQGDRMAMAHSVEIRLPFLDPSVMDFMGRVPAKWKILGLNEKHILKKAFKGILPEEILRRPKNPYRAPIKQSLLNQKIVDYTQEAMSEASLKNAGLFDAGKVARLLRKMTVSGSPSEIDDMALMGILSSQLVYQKFVEDFPVRTAREVCPDLIVDHRSEALKPVQ
jgi:asparagine synthase (glutamine-hydrolysing)